LRRALLLVAEDVRQEARRDDRQGQLLAALHRFQRDLLPAAPRRPAGHATSGRDLHPGRALGVVQPRLDDRLGDHGARHTGVLVERVPLAQRSASRERPVGRGHARVVHDLAAARAQLRQRPVRDERAPAPRPTPEAGDQPVSETAPGPWLRLTALAASAATLLAVVSGAAGLGTAHRILAALALPPFAALLVGTWTSHRRLFPAVLAATGLFGVAALVTARGAHLALAAVAFAA